MVIRPTRYSNRKFLQDLHSISQIHSDLSSSRLIIIHSKCLYKRQRILIRPPISDQPVSNDVGVVPLGDVVVHPNLTINTHRLNTHPLTQTMGKPSTSSKIRNTNKCPTMWDIHLKLIVLHLTWTNTTLRYAIPLLSLHLDVSRNRDIASGSNWDSIPSVGHDSCLEVQSPSYRSPPIGMKSPRNGNSPYHTA
ncbi:hypothetical protein [Sweet potato leaf curl Uganda virus-[Uganda:Kampala:2008]]|uniref:AC5 n=1 Tax=Sweet potato leaf curl Uganda virus-[Uganda:Kampala:2008] TaxID=940846 RepID=E8ZGG2_9GEMI|nr:hypothetical protein SPLCUV_gp2 [Sweet potato leaf curl Uganda virus-[Uganda:Kampala:2008]]CBY85116.1 hypothetical protein [Sweet potato leaf curl Uganda virus-[Uganda:Kampala:2008]]